MKAVSKRQNTADTDIIAAHSAYDMFHGIKYLIVSLVFSHLGFRSGNLFLIAPFPDLCLLVPFYYVCFVCLMAYA